MRAAWRVVLGTAVSFAALTLSVAPPAGGANATNDPLLVRQWALRQISAPAAWQQGVRGDGVLIGVVDTGVDLEHVDLRDKVVDSTRCVGTGGRAEACDGDGQDIHGHGSHVAGIAAATTDNGEGIAAVAPGAGLLVVNAFDWPEGSAQPEADIRDVNAGIVWAVDRGARVVNLSLGANFAVNTVLGTNLRAGIDYAYDAGAVVVLASGNENLLGVGVGSSNYGDLDAIVVGATGRNGGQASYSAPTNSKWGLLAPGGDTTNCNQDFEECVLSTIWKPDDHNLYGYLQGTSQATPHVSGAAALLLGQGLGRDATIARLLETADPAVGPCGTGCAGRLDVAAATGVAAPAPKRPAANGSPVEDRPDPDQPDPPVNRPPDSETVTPPDDEPAAERDGRTTTTGAVPGSGDGDADGAEPPERDGSRPEVDAIGTERRQGPPLSSDDEVASGEGSQEGSRTVEALVAGALALGVLVPAGVAVLRQRGRVEPPPA
jgi:subtilisin family serine protease